MAQQTCCDHKGKLKKGLWSPEEDEKLVRYVTQHGIGSWSDVPKHAGLQRCGKSCRLRWINYLRPDLKRGMFTVAEEDLIINLHRLLGNRWSQIASQLPGRTDNEIKNYWNSCIKKKLRKMGINPNAPNRPRMLGESSSREHLLARDVTPRLQPPAPLTLGQILPQNQPVVNPLREPDPIAVPPQYNNNGVFGHLGQTDAVVPQMAPQLVLPRLQVPIPEVQMHLLPVPNRPRLHGLDFHGYVYRRIVPADDVAMDIVGQNFPEQGEAGNEQDPSGELDYEDGESLDMSPRSEDDLDLDSMICQWCQGSLPQPPPEEYFQLYGDEPVRTAGPGPGQSSVSTQVDSWAHLMQRLGVDHQDDPMDEPMAPSVHNPRYQI